MILKHAYILTACAILTGSAATAAPASAWDSSLQARARLVTAGSTAPGHYLAAIEIELKGGAHTYWRTPGDSGVPPEITFDGSKNLAGTRVLWPAPVKLDEAGLAIFGYEHEVVLPVEVTAATAKDPVELDVAMNYATCEKICVPAKAHLQLTLAPGAAAGPQAKLVHDWRARVPKPLGAPGAPALAVTALPPGKDGKPAWHVSLDPALASPTIFPEAAAGWYLVAQNVTPKGFDLAAAEMPAKGAPFPKAEVTIVSAAGAFSGALDLDAPPPKP